MTSITNSPPGMAEGRAAGAQQGPRSLQATAHPAQDARVGGVLRPKRVGQTPFYDLLPGSIRDDAGITAAAASLDPSRRTLALGIPHVLLWARLEASLRAARPAGPEDDCLSPPLQRLVDLGGGLKPLTEAELELLAYQFHVDFRETATTREQLAAMVRNAIPWHRIKGTPASLKAALGLFGYEATIEEYGAPAPGLPPEPQPFLDRRTDPTGDRRSCPFERSEVRASRAERRAACGAWSDEGRASRASPASMDPTEERKKVNGTGRWWATYQLGLPQIADTATVRQIVRICTEMAPARCRLWRIYTDAFDRRPIILSQGPALGDGWLTFYSGAPVPVDPDNPDSDDVLVSFGVRNGYQSEPYAVGDLCGSFGATTWYGFLAPYLDRFVVGRSKLSALYPRNHGFAMGSLFSILWAERATTGRRWRGEWDARRWLDYTGFDRQLPQWRMERRAASRAQLVLSDGRQEGGSRAAGAQRLPRQSQATASAAQDVRSSGIMEDWGEVMGDHNARLGATFAAVIDNPPRLGAFTLSGHDPQRRVLRLHEMFIHASGLQTTAVSPAPRPPLAGAARLSVTCPVPDPVRASQARQDTAGLRMDARQAPAPREAGHSWRPLLAQALDPALAPPAGVAAYRAPQWLGTWAEPGRTWRTETLLSVQ